MSLVTGEELVRSESQEPGCAEDVVPSENNENTEGENDSFATDGDGKADTVAEQCDIIPDRSELKQGTETESPSPLNKCDIDVETNIPQLSVDTTAGETAEEKHSTDLSDGDSKELPDPGVVENKGGRTPMRRRKVQALQKREKSIKKKNTKGKIDSFATDRKTDTVTEQCDIIADGSELKQDTETESPSPLDKCDIDVETNIPQLSVDTTAGETAEEKHSTDLSDGDSKELPDPGAVKNKGRWTSMRRCKVQALQKREESIKKRKLKSEMPDDLVFSSDDDGEQVDDSDEDPVWTPADKERKAEQKKGNPRKYQRRSASTQEKSVQLKVNTSDTAFWETVSDEIMVESSNSYPSYDNVTRQIKFLNANQSKLPSDGKTQDQEFGLINKEPMEKITEVKTSEYCQRKMIPRTSYKYTQSNHMIEGHFKTGNFVMAIADKDNPCPPIWRIEGKSLLQRFEPFNDNGRLLYRNASSYSAWNSSTMHKYTGVNVLLVSNNRTSSVVESLGPISTGEEMNNFPQVNQSPPAWLYNCPNGDPAEISKSLEELNYPTQDSFEVFLQTLLSHVLDPSFIIEIIKENDDYFLSHLNSISETTEEKKKKIFENNELSEQLKNMVETLPSINVLPNSDANNQMCDVCKQAMGQHVIHCVGQPYDSTSLMCKPLSEEKFPPGNKVPVCATCAHAVVLYSHMHHHKYNFFLKCKKKVDDVRSFKQNKEESHLLLEECLQDTVWVTQMFQEIKDMWSASDNLR